MCGQIRVKTLYADGTKFTVWPLRVTYSRYTTEGENKVLVWAPKSLFKHAVDRNRLKRLMREAYRLNQSLLEQEGLYIAFNYMDKQIQPYHTIEKAIKKAIAKLNTTVGNGNDSYAE